MQARVGPALRLSRFCRSRLTLCVTFVGRDLRLSRFFVSQPTCDFHAFVCRDLRLSRFCVSRLATLTLVWVSTCDSHAFVGRDLRLSRFCVSRPATLLRFVGRGPLLRVSRSATHKSYTESQSRPTKA